MISKEMVVQRKSEKIDRTRTKTSDTGYSIWRPQTMCGTGDDNTQRGVAGAPQDIVRENSVPPFDNIAENDDSRLCSFLMTTKRTSVIDCDM